MHSLLDYSCKKYFVVQDKCKFSQIYDWYHINSFQNYTKLCLLFMIIIN